MERFKLAVEFQHYFSDRDFTKMDLEKDQLLIIERLLSHGDHEALGWVLATYSLEEIKQTVMISQNLDEKTACYWQHYFNLRKEDM